MEIILAIVVAAAVIFFGALISTGNERQRRAIDGLREQLVQWAIQDLRIKRERLAREVRVDNPLEWLNKVVAKVSGQSLNLQVVEALQHPQIITCMTADSRGKVLLTPLTPGEVHALKRAKHGRLSKSGDQNPFRSLPKNVKAFECTVLNSGIMFDLELPLAWKGLSGQNTPQMDRIWVYVAIN